MSVSVFFLPSWQSLWQNTTGAWVESSRDLIVHINKLEDDQSAEYLKCSGHEVLAQEKRFASLHTDYNNHYVGIKYSGYHQGGLYNTAYSKACNKLETRYKKTERDTIFFQILECEKKSFRDNRWWFLWVWINSLNPQSCWNKQVV